MKNSFFRATDIGVMIILLATMGASFSAYETFRGYLLVDELSDVNAAGLSVWQEIGEEIGYLLEISEAPDANESGLLIERVQLRLRGLLSESDRVDAQYQEQLTLLKAINWPVVSVSDKGRDVLLKSIPEQLVRNAREASQAPQNLVRAGFSHWNTFARVAFQSGNLTTALRERGELLATIKSESTAALWRLLSILVSVLFVVTCFVWLALLRPAARKLSEARQELGIILDTIPALVTSYSQSGHLQTSNRTYLERWNFPGEGSHVSEVVGPKLWPEIRGHFERALKGERVGFDVPLKTPNGVRMQSAEYIPSRDLKGEVTRVIIMITDVQDRYDSARNLRENEEKLRITLDSIGDGVISTDVSGLVMHMNPVACRMTGWTVEEAVGIPLTQVFHIVNRDTRRRVDNPVDKVLKTGVIVGLANHTVLISRDGSEYDIKDSGAPIFSVENEVVGVVLVFRDATEEVALNERIVNGEKMRAVGQLAGGIAHDINNQLGIIRGYSELLRMNPDNVQSKLDQIVGTCDRAAGLIDKLRAFSQQKAGRLQPIRVEELVTTTIDILQSTVDRRIRLSLETSGETFIVNGDASLLQSAFMNIGLNAVQAMPEGGELSISIQENSAQELRRGALALPQLSHERCVSVVFQDTGSGIPKENLERIFEPYFSTKLSGSEAGSGLGLAMVYGVVDEHNGVVFAQNAEEGGTRMTIVLPMVDKGKFFPDTQSIGDEPQPVFKLHVLLVEDEEQLRKIGSEMLENLGCSVVSTADGKAGLDAFHSTPDDFDLVLLDVNMPGMSGLELLEELKKIRPQVSAVLVTGFADDIYAQAESDRSIVTVLKKPFSFSELTATLERFVRSLE